MRINLQTFTAETDIFLREHLNGMYRTDVYFLSKMIAELLIFVVFPFFAFLIPYFPVGLNPSAERFFTSAGILILVANSAASFGMKVSYPYAFVLV